MALRVAVSLQGCNAQSPAFPAFAGRVGPGRCATLVGAAMTVALGAASRHREPLRPRTRLRDVRRAIAQK